jgi:hypothetical protein
MTNIQNYRINSLFFAQSPKKKNHHRVMTIKTAVKIK